MFPELEDYYQLLQNLKASDNMYNINSNNVTDEYTLLEIDLSERDDIILHTDPNYLKGFYTYDNLAPNTIKVIKNNL